MGSAVLALLEFEKIKDLLASLPGLDGLAAVLRKTAETGGGCWLGPSRRQRSASRRSSSLFR